MPAPISTAVTELSHSKTIILAAHYASSADLKALRAVISHHRSTLQGETLLRVLLCLPETTSPGLYIPLLEYAISSANDDIIRDEGAVPEEASSLPVSEMSEKAAGRRVKQLPRFALLGGFAANRGDDDLLFSFLIHRSRAIDRETGALSIIANLLSPFRTRLPEVERYLTGIVEVLSRLVYHYELGEEEGNLQDNMRRLEEFDSLAPQVGARMLLAQCGNAQTVVSDLEGLVGPFLRSKGNDYEGWGIVWEWLRGKAMDGSWDEFVEIATRWSGPRGHKSLEDEFARIAIAGCYLCRETEPRTWDGMRAICRRAASLGSARDTPSSHKAPDRVGDLFEEDNLLSSPSPESLRLLDVLITSASILSIPLASVTGIMLEGSHDDQKTLLARHVRSGPNWMRRGDDEWRVMRKNVMWMQSKAGVLGKLTAGETEGAILTALLAAAKFALVKEIYVNVRRGRETGKGYARAPSIPAKKQVAGGALVVSPPPPGGTGPAMRSFDGFAQDLRDDRLVREPVDLSKEGVGTFDGFTESDVERGVLDAFQEFYDNASNGNKTRGSMRNALGALQILYPERSKSVALQRAFRLVDATHALSHYSLTLTPGVPLLPVQIRIHPDPISLIARLLDSNLNSYAQAESLVSIAKGLRFGTSGDDGGKLTEARVLGMCIEAALSESDFETAYSLAMGRLVILVPGNEQDANGDGVEDLIWRACLQAGRYRSPYVAADTTTTHGGAALRTMEMRMELLAQALRFCPPPALAEVLSAWKRCEEEMLAGLREEEEEEQKLDTYWNPDTTTTAATTTTTTTRRRDDETPMGLFAVAAGAAKALRGTAFPLAAAARAQVAETNSPTSATMAMTMAAAEEQRTRKRDVVTGMVTSGLASGLGWVLGAQPNIEKR